MAGFFDSTIILIFGEEPEDLTSTVVSPFLNLTPSISDIKPNFSV